MPAEALVAPEGRSAAVRGGRRHGTGARTRALTLAVAAAFLAVAVQLLHLAASAGGDLAATVSEAIAQSFARPDLVDRNGRLLATDVKMPSLYADPSIVQSKDEASEKLASVLPDLDPKAVRSLLDDRDRRFVWIRRGLSPKIAQKVHDLGLPELAFRYELRRAYPLGRLAGHVLGHVNIDNKGVAGIERYVYDAKGVEPVHGATLSAEAPLRLSLDVGVQHTLEEELAGAMHRYGARGAAGLVMDVAAGEISAAASLPRVDPSRPADGDDAARLDKVSGGAFELGSVWKIVTLAMALEGGRTSLETMIDVTQPLSADGFKIADLHPAGRPLTVAEVFVRSSNIGAGLLALEAGAERQRAFLERLGLWGAMRTEAGAVAEPILPGRLGRAEQITISYGHGIAVAPIQFAAAVAGLINGGERVEPTFLRRTGGASPSRVRVVSPATSANIRELLRMNVTDPAGTGHRADVPGYRVGGKTGTADMPGPGGYRQGAVISSFLAAFPMDAPKALVLVSLFEPTATVETNGEILAGVNAAPTAARIIERVAPLLGVLPQPVVAAARN
jgi:cell division protein FtsI (penicillin-binding protein 3)